MCIVRLDEIIIDSLSCHEILVKVLTVQSRGIMTKDWLNSRVSPKDLKVFCFLIIF